MFQKYYIYAVLTLVFVSQNNYAQADDTCGTHLECISLALKQNELQAKEIQEMKAKIDAKDNENKIILEEIKMLKDRLIKLDAIEIKSGIVKAYKSDPSWSLIKATSAGSPTVCYRRREVFSSPFKANPQIIIALSHLDSSHQGTANPRVDVKILRLRLNWVKARRSA
jgi:hypothetical protein